MEVFTEVLILDENFFCKEINFPFKKLNFFLELPLLAGFLWGFFS